MDAADMEATATQPKIVPPRIPSKLRRPKVRLAAAITREAHHERYDRSLSTTTGRRKEHLQPSPATMIASMR